MNAPIPNDHPNGNKLMNALASRFLSGMRVLKFVTAEGVQIKIKDQVFDYLSEDTAALVGQEAWVCFNLAHPETIAISPRQDFSGFKIVPRVIPRGPTQSQS